MTDIRTPETADHETRILLDTCLHVDTSTFMLPPDKQAITASNTPVLYDSKYLSFTWSEVPKSRGGLQTRMTPRSRWRPAMILKKVSLSPRTTAERMMVTRGLANTIHRASGTAM